MNKTENELLLFLKRKASVEKKKIILISLGIIIRVHNCVHARTAALLSEDILGACLVHSDA